MGALRQGSRLVCSLGQSLQSAPGFIAPSAPVSLRLASALASPRSAPELVLSIRVVVVGGVQPYVWEYLIARLLLFVFSDRSLLELSAWSLDLLDAVAAPCPSGSGSASGRLLHQGVGRRGPVGEA